MSTSQFDVQQYEFEDRYGCNPTLAANPTEDYEEINDVREMLVDATRISDWDTMEIENTAEIDAAPFQVLPVQVRAFIHVGHGEATVVYRLESVRRSTRNGQPRIHATYDVGGEE